MTTWLDFRSELVTERPEVEEYIGTFEWSAKCKANDCKWNSSGERSYAEWMTDMHEDIERHKQWHEDGMPE